VRAQLCIIAIVSTRLGELYLSPNCGAYDSVKNMANVYVPSAVGASSAWNISHTAVTTTDFLGRLTTYRPPRDYPGCVPMLKSAAPVPFLPDATTPWGAPENPWPRERGLPITGTFGQPPTGRLPNFSLVSGELLTGAIVITLVASLESIAIAKALVSKHKQPNFDPSQEYVALGIANFFGSFTGAYPISGSFSRSALNDEVGATSPVAVLTVAALVGVVVKLASVAPLFYYLPQNALSAIVIVALTNLLDVEHFFWLLKYDRKDALLWLTAFGGVLFLGVEIGILVSVVASLAMVVVETLLAPTPLLGLVPGNSKRAFRSTSQYPEADTIPGVVIMRVESPICFFNVPSIASKLRALVYGSDATRDAKKQDATAPSAVVVDFSNVPYIDSAALEAFGDLIDAYKRAEVLLAFANPNSNVLHKLTITPLLRALSTQFGEERDWIFLTVSDAVDAVRRYEPPMKALKLADASEDDAAV
jgi:sulfate transporter 4